MENIGLMPSFGGFIATVIAFVVALSIIVAVHEYGHYIVGRWSGIKADVFSLGFGPTLFSRVDRHGTRWQISALPLGGYVKFRGDSDAASGKDAAVIEALPEEERRHTMHGAPLWARAATVAAGPVFNFILSIAIFAGFFMIRGIAVEEPVIGALRPLPAAVQELQVGDRILSVEGRATPDLKTFFTVTDEITPADTVAYRVLRDTAEADARGPFPFPPLVEAVQPQSAAIEAGLRRGDVITAIDGQPIHAFRELRQIVGDSGGRALKLAVWRDGTTTEVTLTPRRADIPKAEGGFETRWLIGLNGGPAFEPLTRRAGPVESLGLAASQTWDIATTSLSGLWHIVTGAISTCNLRGPVGIAETSGAAASQGVASFIWFIAVLSTAVGLLNLFPVPVLDGGHLVFHVWEAVTGKPPTDRALRLLMGIGIALIGAMMVIALSNDLFLCP